jgi:hypothetical protein
MARWHADVAARRAKYTCQHCGRVGTHTSICWAIGKGADNISVAQGSSSGGSDEGATDRAETNYERMLAGEEYGSW